MEPKGNSLVTASMSVAENGVAALLMVEASRKQIDDPERIEVRGAAADICSPSVPQKAKGPRAIGAFFRLSHSFVWWSQAGSNR